MQLRKDVTVRNICGQQFIILRKQKKCSVINFNETVTFLWQKFSAVPSFTEQDVTTALIDEYDIDEATALTDSHDVITQWQDLGLLLN